MSAEQACDPRKRASVVRRTREQWGGAFDPATKVIVYHHGPGSNVDLGLPNLFNVEIPAVDFFDKRLKTRKVSFTLSRRYGFHNDAIANAVTGKLSRIVSGQRVRYAYPKRIHMPMHRDRKRFRL